jgi:hypothetical protein
MKRVNVYIDGAPVKAYVSYWNASLDVISNITVDAETVYPLTLPQAILGFRPELAEGANVIFESVDGSHSTVNVFKF